MFYLPMSLTINAATDDTVTPLRPSTARVRVWRRRQGLQSRVRIPDRCWVGVSHASTGPSAGSVGAGDTSTGRGRCSGRGLGVTLTSGLFADCSEVGSATPLGSNDVAVNGEAQTVAPRSIARD